MTKKNKCRRCGSENLLLKEVTFKNGTLHTKADCLDCALLFFAPRELEENQNDFSMPFGKYKGSTLLEISRSDPDYLMWAASTLKGNIQRRINLFLDSKKLLPRQ